MISDQRGFMWFGTINGISRFDGKEFVNYGTEHGLPVPAVNDMIQTRGGSFWIGTENGLCRFHPKRVRNQLLFETFHPGPTVNESFVRCLHEDENGRLWIGTGIALFVCDNPDADVPDFEQVVGEERRVYQPNATGLGLPGTVGTSDGLPRRFLPSCGDHAVNVDDLRE